MKNFFSLAIATFLVSLSGVSVSAQTVETVSRSAEVLLVSQPTAVVVKREVTPGIVKFNRLQGCWVQNPISTNYLDDGTVLSTPIQLAASGNTVPEWRREYRQPWKSQLSDYEGGEQKYILLQIGRHPAKLIGVEESDKKLTESQTACAVAAYKIFGNNLRLLQPIAQKRQNDLSVSLEDVWSINFTMRN